MKDGYITIDHDDVDQGIELIRLLYMIGCDGDARISSSGDGVHIRISKRDTDTVSLDRLDHLRVRYMFCDDYGRVEGDFRRYMSGSDSFENLFYRKNGESAGEWKTFKQVLENGLNDE